MCRCIKFRLLRNNYAATANFLSAFNLKLVFNASHTTRFPSFQIPVETSTSPYWYIILLSKCKTYTNSLVSIGQVVFYYFFIFY